MMHTIVYEGIGSRRDWVTKGLGHEGIGSRRDWVTKGLGHVMLKLITTCRAALAMSLNFA
jgi:hypothetical protein